MQPEERTSHRDGAEHVKPEECGSPRNVVEHVLSEKGASHRDTAEHVKPKECASPRDAGNHENHHLVGSEATLEYTQSLHADYMRPEVCSGSFSHGLFLATVEAEALRRGLPGDGPAG